MFTYDLGQLGLVAGAGHEADIEQRAESNRRVFARAIEELRSKTGGTLVVPDGKFPITAPVQETASRRRRARYAIVLSDARNVRIVSRNGRSTLSRLEREAVTGADMDATLAVVNASSITIEGLAFEGHQESDPKKATTGNSISLLYGSQDITLQDITTNKGTNGIAVGDNRPVGSPSSTDFARAVKDVRIERASIYNGEHAILVNVAEGVSIRDVHHTTKPYTYRGAPQPEYIQRGLYLLGCRRISASRCTFDKAHKTGVLLAVYPASRTYSHLEDVSLDDIRTTSSCPRDIDYHIGLQLLDHNRKQATVRYIRNISAKRLRVSNARAAVQFRETSVDNDLRTAVISNVTLDEAALEGDTHGITGIMQRPLRNILLDANVIRVNAAPSCAQRPPVFGVQLEARGAKQERQTVSDRPTTLSLNRCKVDSGGTALRLRGLDRCQLSGSSFGSTEAAGGPGWDADISDCTNVRINECRLISNRLKLERSPSASKGWIAGPKR